VFIQMAIAGQTRKRRLSFKSRKSSHSATPASAFNPRWLHGFGL